MVLALLIAWLNAWTERDHLTLAYLMIDQCGWYATADEAQWWADKRERLESLKIAASDMGWFRPAHEMAPWDVRGQEKSGLAYTAGFINVLRMRRQGVITRDGHP